VLTFGSQHYLIQTVWQRLGEHGAPAFHTYLRNLDISHPFLSLESTSLVGHHLFLEAHQSQLQHLTFDFVAQSSGSGSLNITDEFFNHEWCHVLLPELQFLSFHLSSFTVSFEAAAITYFQRQIPNLESLEIHQLCFSYNQLATTN